MKYYSYKVDIISVDELRDMCGDGGCPSAISGMLWSDRDAAIAAMIQEANEVNADWNRDEDDEYKRPLITAVDENDGFDVDEVERYQLIEFEVAP